ncbi:MAG: tetratricopeptide repeat protein, partial [Acidobacteriota bacterium]
MMAKDYQPGLFYQKSPFLLLVSTLVVSLVLLACQNNSPSLTNQSLETRSIQFIGKLKIGKPIEQQLAGGRCHAFQIPINGGQYAQIVVEQRGIDVTLKLYDPAGNRLVEIDSPNGTRGSEIISLVAAAEKTDNYRLEVQSTEETAARGSYQIRITELRTAKVEDTHRITAQQAYSEGEALRLKGTAEAFNEALKKYDLALTHWQAVNDRAGIGHTLNNIGAVYFAISDSNKSLDYYQQALTYKHNSVDQSGEANTLSNMGLVYSELGETQKALTYYHQALPLCRQVEDNWGIANILNNIGAVNAKTGQPDKAIEYYTQALPFWRQAGARRQEAATLSNLG